MNSVTRFLYSLLLTLCFTGKASAGGYAIPYQGARAVGLASALTAHGVDPSVVYYNPAALTEVEGSQVLASLNYVNIVSSVTNSGRESINTQADHFIPTIFANYHLPETDITLGIGLYTPFGLATRYDAGDFTRFAAIRSELLTRYLTPAFAWRFHETLAIGVGMSFIDSSAVFSRALMLGPGAEGKIKISGSDRAYGLTAGLLYTPHQKLQLGLTIRGGADLDFTGARVQVVTATGAIQTARAKATEIPLPTVVSMGIHWQIEPNWSVDLAHDFTDWSEFRHLKARFNPPLLSGALPGLLLRQKWKNTSTLRLATSYRIKENWEVRCGAVLDESPIPGKTLGPSIPGADTLTLNSGIGWQWNRWSADLGYAAVFSKSRRVDNDVLEANSGSPVTPGRDKYATFDNFVSLSVSYRF